MNNFNSIDTIIFNSDQLEAEKKINEFLSSDKREFTLIGKAGCGKTTILRKIFKNKQNVIGCTVSHKARIVLSQSIEKSSTIASALGMNMVFNDSGEIKFVVDKTFRGVPLIHSAKYIIVDECSMISSYILNEIRLNARRDAKILFVGDYHQLPPIDEDREPNEDSKVFYIEDKYELKKRVRQGDTNPIIGLSDEIADSIETNHDLSFLKNLKSNYNNDDNCGYILLKKQLALESIVQKFNENKDVKLIAYRNETILKYNEYIRNMLFDTNENIVIGDKLIAMDNQYGSKQKLIFYNSDEFSVENVNIVNYMGIESYMVKATGINESFYVPTKVGKIDYLNELDMLKKEALNDRKKWVNYFAYKQHFANVQHAYAINSHKAQGSTYETVFVDLHDITSVVPTTSKEKLQSLYVAVTRASKNLAIII